MQRCIIIVAYNEGSIKKAIEINKDDYIICADGGYYLAYKEGIIPNVVIGDFDSDKSNIKFNGEIISYPSEKDDTDCMLCIKYALEKGFNNIIIIGGIGGRLDHTIANIQSLAYAFEKGADIKMIDENNIVFIMENDCIEIEKCEGWKMSIFALRPKCNGVSLYNVKYPLDNVILTDSFPLGISNEFKQGNAKVECTDGRLLIIITKGE